MEKRKEYHKNYYEKNKAKIVEYNKNYRLKMKDIKERYENNEHLTEEEIKLYTNYYKNIRKYYELKKDTDEYKINRRLSSKNYYENNIDKINERKKLYYHNLTHEKKIKYINYAKEYYYNNRDEILNKMKSKYELLKDKLIEYNKKYWLKRKKEKYARLYEHGKQILNDIMELNLGYSNNFEN